MNGNESDWEDRGGVGQEYPENGGWINMTGDGRGTAAGCGSEAADSYGSGIASGYGFWTMDSERAEIALGYNWWITEGRGCGAANGKGSSAAAGAG